MSMIVSTPAPAPRLLLPAHEAAEVLSVSARTLWAMTEPRGPIPCVRIGRRVLYSVAALTSFIEEVENQAANA